jgi:hypothetical protein
MFDIQTYKTESIFLNHPVDDLVFLNEISCWYLYAICTKTIHLNEEFYLGYNAV